ncbi:MAG: OmpA family protein [Bacteroidota bacterium]
MSTLTKRILILAVWVLYMILLYLFFFPHFKSNCCGDGALITDDNTQTEEAVNNYPLASQWDTLGIFTGPGFPDLKSKLLADDDDESILEFIGYYYEGETTPEGYESLGLARADQIRQLHFPDLPSERIKLSARPFGVNADVRKGFFPAGSLKWIKAEDKVKENVEILDDRILIRFPYNSTEKVYDPTVEAYIEQLAETLKGNEETIELTGHTDNIGSPEFNVDLGMRRAGAIRDLLLAKGIDSSRIKIASKGLTLPVDTNETEEGRQNNRRVELVRIPVEG